MIEATDAVRAVLPEAFGTHKRHMAVSAPIRKAILVLLAECATYACIGSTTYPAAPAGIQNCVHNGRCEWICEPGAARLVEETGWGFSTVERAMRQLVEDGWILAERRGKGRLYRINRVKLHAEHNRKPHRRNVIRVPATGVVAELIQSKVSKVPTPVRGTQSPVSLKQTTCTATGMLQVADCSVAARRRRREAIPGHSGPVHIGALDGESLPSGADLAVGRQVWDGMSKALKEQLGSSSFGRWILPIMQLGVKDATLYLSVPSEEWDQVPSRYDIESYLPEGIHAISFLVGWKGDL